MSAHEVAAWAALGISLVLLASLVTLVVLVLRFWRKVAPTVTPMLSMFAPPDPAATALDRIADAIEVGEHDGGARP